VVRAINRFITRHVVKVTAAQNTETEHVGAVNRVSAYAYGAKRFFEKAKRANRPLYYAAKYAAMLGLLYLIFVHFR
jgi:beta-hydroxylase